MVDGYANVFSSAATLKIGASRDLDYNGPAVWSVFVHLHLHLLFTIWVVLSFDRIRNYLLLYEIQS